MDLNIFTVLIFTLFAGGHSLKCLQCTSLTGSCSGVETTCTTDFTTCTSGTGIATIGNIKYTTSFKSCFIPQFCGNSAVNIGVTREVVSLQCCSIDLCNSQDVPDSSSNSPNGKQCYYCDGNGCSNTLNCLGNEDYCLKATTNITSLPSTVKGCVSKTICDAASQVPQGYGQISCCQGNLCNGAKSITLNLLFLSWPFFFSILIH